jgi:predicted secreted acid phosphatase
LKGERFLLLRSAESSKESRRQEVTRDYKIALLIGDTLANFSAIFDKGCFASGDPSAERDQVVDGARRQFGARWIVLPNAM